MKRTWTIIGVGDVRNSFKWYQALFGQPETFSAHDYFRNANTAQEEGYYRFWGMLVAVISSRALDRDLPVLPGFAH